MWERIEERGGSLHVLCGEQRAPPPRGTHGRGAGPPQAHVLGGGGEGCVTPGPRGWGSGEHSVPSVTTHVESVCNVSGGPTYSVFPWPSRSDAFRSQILLQIISWQIRETHSGRRNLTQGDLGVTSPWLPLAPLASLSASAI